MQKSRINEKEKRIKIGQGSDILNMLKVKYEFEEINLCSYLKTMEDTIIELRDNFQNNGKLSVSLCNSAGISYDFDDYDSIIDMFDVTLPQLLRKSFIMSSWSFFEQSIKEISKQVKCNCRINPDEIKKIFKKSIAEKYLNKTIKTKNINIRFSDLKGSLLGKTRIYFNKALNKNRSTDITKNSLNWEHLWRLGDIRNLFVHNNGEIEKCNAKLRKYINKEINSKYFEINSRYLTIKRNNDKENDYLYKSIKCIMQFLVSLIDKLRENYI